MFGPALHFGVDARRAQFRLQRGHRIGDEVLALVALLVQHGRDFLVQLGLEVAESVVFQLPLELPDAEAVGERRKDVQRLLRIGPAQGVGRAREETQRLGAARQPHQHHADVFDHGEEHFAQHLGLRAARGAGFLSRQCAGDHAQPVKLGDARDQCRDRRAEGGSELVLAVGQILGHREQDAGDARLGVQPQRGEGGDHAQRVFQHRLARAEQLVRVHGNGEFVGAAQPDGVGFGQAGGDRS